MMKLKLCTAALLAAFFCCSGAIAADNAAPFLGSWAFELPDNNAAWLDVHESDGALAADLLWSVGSARPVNDVSIADGVLSFQRNLKWRPYGENVVKLVTEPMKAIMKNGALELTVRQTEEGKDGVETFAMIGKRLPPMPPKPDLSEVKFGEPIELFNGRNLDGWKLSNPKKISGWSAKNGELVNETPKTDFGAYGAYGNLITEQVFLDFQLDIEYNVQTRCNSGVYLAGMYEAQVVDRDSRMQGIQGPGAIFGRIAPLKNAGKPGGEWNRYEITLVDRHVTIVLNGEKVIDNQPVPGPTGGAVSADVTQPGPLFLQGDHTNVRYRNIILRPRLE